MRHVLEIDDLAPEELRDVLDRSLRPARPVLAGRSVAIVLELPSARTRNATEMAVVDLAGHGVVIGGEEVGIDRRETAEDVARTLGSFHSVLCARVRDHRVLERMAGALDAGGFDVGVVNLLSDEGHPVQALADVLTLAEDAGGSLDALRGRTVAWVGDANNVARSMTLACLGVGMRVVVCAPSAHAFGQGDLDRFAIYADRAGLGGLVEVVARPSDAVAQASAIATDVWVSMGQEAEREERLRSFEGFCLDERLMSAAPSDAVVLHCLPAHRGEEISDGVLESPRSRVWRQVANRRTAMRGLLDWLVTP